MLVREFLEKAYEYRMRISVFQRYGTIDRECI